MEKTKAVQGIIKKLEIENKGVSDPKDINNEINRYYIEKVIIVNIEIQKVNIENVIHKDFAKVTISS